MNFIKGWYVIYTKSHLQRKIAQNLAERDFTIYLSLNIIMSQWSDRKKKVEKPLFNLYVFIYLEIIKDYFKAFIMDEIVLFIRSGGKLVRILDEEINRIKVCLNHYYECKGIHELNIEEKESYNIRPFRVLSM
ncbi:transcription termination/antitermination protein NusG [Chryseobacterium sp. PTM-20240506]|uniref:transcription termination/antitermination protein NusG n=1 Tax=unclassified Chryseobacterium TaxID=2593645 RepID=UPI002359A5B3|nr:MULTISPECIES: transcription termination/antitermination NusG family protein [unclassified Chryseobacterium]MDC8104572.1 transcription termination/antitermination NusG family protein [Chryseobacterium sp. B21-037]MDQ1806103.1 transcription termination/antitermination NusG family protein [Chryseobacterium sp. CKR4-1]